MERRLLCLQLPLQHLHLTACIVQTLAVGSPVLHQSGKAVVLLPRLGELLPGSRHLFFHIGPLRGIHQFGGTYLPRLQVELHRVDESHLPALPYPVALVHIQQQQFAVLFRRHRHLRSLESARGVILLFLVAA